MTDMYKSYKEIYGTDFQIPIYNDRAFKSLVKSHKDFIIKLLSELCNFNIEDVEDSYFLDTETNNTYFDENKLTVDLILGNKNDNYLNIEMNTNINYSTLVRNNLYAYRIILGKSNDKKYKNINLTQINIDLKSYDFMKKIVNKFEMMDETTLEKLPYFFTIYHIGLDKVEENPYNENISDYAVRSLKMFVSKSRSETKKLAGNYKDLKEVAEFMNNYSNDLSNLIYYNPEEDAAKIRLTEIDLAKESGYSLGKTEGISEGIEQTKASIARNMLLKDIPITEISSITGLTEEEILKLKNN